MHSKKLKIVAATIVLLLLMSVITVNAQVNKNKELILGGMPFGLKLFTNGVIIIEIDESGCAAKKAGLKENDVIVKANESFIENNEQLKQLIKHSGGKEIRLKIIRDNKEISKTIIPQKDTNENYVAGIWIRDSTAGIGTITYFDPQNKSFGALGHGICDKDTGMLMPLKNGEITSASISHCTKATDGVVGGLNGYFEDEKIGNITINNGFGLYGNYDYTTENLTILASTDEEIQNGEAYIYSTIDGKKPQKYSVKISNLNLCNTNGQNMIVTVTDQRLLDKTGGIVQGMSGSPIVQNGKLVGAVTHVFVNSPEKGYGISISNMLSNYEQFN